jgi:peptidoglycan/LPS O-acetylase OafA/YrhL
LFSKAGDYAIVVPPAATGSALLEAKPFPHPLPKRIPELDGLRGLAILLVILFHYLGETAGSIHNPVFRYLTRGFGIGWVGVDLFFVLSGFLIGGILLTARESENYFRTFYLRRIHRIFPLYYAWLGVYAVIVIAGLYFGYSSFKASSLDLAHLPRYALFFQNFYGAKTPLQFIWLAPTWSLAVEEQFYLVAPLMVRFLSERHLKIVLLAIITLAPIARLLTFLFIPNGNYLALIVTPCRADCLAMGMLAAIAIRSPAFWNFIERRPGLIRIAKFLAAVMIMALCPWLALPYNTLTTTLGLSMVGAFFAYLVLLVIIESDGLPARFARNGFLRRAGTLSYCLYMIHHTVNLLVHRFFSRNPAELRDWRDGAIFLLAAVLTWGIASLSWKFFEGPLMRRGHRYQY